MSKLILLAVSATTGLAFVAGSAQATTIGIEAESFDSVGGLGFTKVNSSSVSGGALGGEYITTNGDAGSSPDATVTYNFQGVAGTYDFYMRYFVPGGSSGSDVNGGETSSNNDSYFAPDAIGDSPSWNIINSIDPGNAWTWANMTADFGAVPQYTLSAGENTFVLGGREDGFIIDKLVFSTDSNLTDAQLDAATAIPEPASLSLLSIAGLLGLIGLRRRKRCT